MPKLSFAEKKRQIEERAVVKVYSFQDIYSTKFKKSKSYWNRPQQSKFIEALLAGVRIMPLYVRNCDDYEGLEIVNGNKRVNAMLSFYNNQLTLQWCHKLHRLEGRKFEDISKSSQSYFLNKEYTVVVLDGDEDEDDVLASIFRSERTKQKKHEAQHPIPETFRVVCHQGAEQKRHS